MEPKNIIKLLALLLLGALASEYLLAAPKKKIKAETEEDQPTAPNETNEQPTKHLQVKTETELAQTPWAAIHAARYAAYVAAKQAQQQVEQPVLTVPPVTPVVTPQAQPTPEPVIDQETTLRELETKLQHVKDEIASAEFLWQISRAEKAGSDIIICLRTQIDELETTKAELERKIRALQPILSATPVVTPQAQSAPTPAPKPSRKRKRQSNQELLADLGELEKMVRKTESEMASVKLAYDMTVEDEGHSTVANDLAEQIATLNENKIELEEQIRTLQQELQNEETE